MPALNYLLCYRPYQAHCIATTIIEEPESGWQDSTCQRMGKNLGWQGLQGRGKVSFGYKCCGISLSECYSSALSNIEVPAKSIIDRACKNTE